MQDNAKARGFKGRRSATTENRPKDRRKGGGRQDTNAARRAQDRQIQLDADDPAAEVLRTVPGSFVVGRKR